MGIWGKRNRRKREKESRIGKDRGKDTEMTRKTRDGKIVI